MLLSMWRKQPPLPGFVLTDHAPTDVQGAQGALRVDYRYKIGDTTFRGNAVLAERDLLLYKFQLYGTESQFTSLPVVGTEIVNSLSIG